MTAVICCNINRRYGAHTFNLRFNFSMTSPNLRCLNLTSLLRGYSVLLCIFRNQRSVQGSYWRRSNSVRFATSFSLSPMNGRPSVLKKDVAALLRPYPFPLLLIRVKLTTTTSNFSLLHNVGDRQLRKQRSRCKTW